MAKRLDGGGNTTPRRYTGGRPPKKLEAEIGSEAYKRLRTLANAQSVTAEALAANWLLIKLEAEWEEYTEGVTEEWELDGTLAEPTPKNIFTAAADAVAEMGNKAEAPPIIV